MAKLKLLSVPLQRWLFWTKLFWQFSRAYPPLIFLITSVVTLKTYICKIYNTSTATIFQLSTLSQCCVSIWLQANLLTKQANSGKIRKMQLVFTDPSRLHSPLNHSPWASTTNKVAHVLLLLMDKKKVSTPCVSGEDKNHIKTARVQDFKKKQYQYYAL